MKRTQVTINDNHIMSAKNTKTKNAVALAVREVTGKAASFDGENLIIGRGKSAVQATVPQTLLRSLKKNGGVVSAPTTFNVTM